MPRTRLSAIAVLLAIEAASAQQADVAAVDFVLRPTQDDGLPIDSSDEAAEPLSWPPEEIGPPLAGPTEDDPLGTPLAGPFSPAEEEVARRLRQEDDTEPFAATGIHLGAFVLRPAIEIGVSATDNARGGSGADKEGAVGLLVAPELVARLDTGRATVDLDLRGEAILYGDEEIDDRAFDARLTGRYDLTGRTTLDAEAGYSFSLDSFTDPDTPAAAVERPGVHNFNARLGGTHRFGRLALGLHGTLDREIYDDAVLAGGGTLSRAELDNTEYALRGRLGYEASGVLQPFVEAAVGRIDYDQEQDSAGFERSTIWGEMLGGVVIDRGSKLSGEAAIGYRHDNVDDPDLDDIDAFIAQAALLWSPRRLTEVRLDVSTETRPTTLVDASGSVLYSGELTVARRLTPRVRAEAGIGLDYETFVGNPRRDVTFSGAAEISYAFSRYASIAARYEYENLESNVPGGDSVENVVSVRVRLQR